jgi:hypothetical protein
LFTRPVPFSPFFLYFSLLSFVNNFGDVPYKYICVTCGIDEINSILNKKKKTERQWREREKELNRERE